MDQLRAREENGESWDLQTDKYLLKALQDLSGDIMASIQGLEAKLSNLEQKARGLSVRAGTAATSFNETCQTQFIQQTVAPPTTSPHDGGRSQKPPLLTASNYQEVVYPKYREALELTCLAFENKSSKIKEWKPLPSIFGSPEYLQDATFGIGAFANEPVDAQQGTDQESKEIESVAASNKSDTAEETTAQEEALLANAVVPDFKSMLEAALRGELDDGLGEDLLREASLSSQDSFSSAQPAEDLQRNELSPEPYPSQQKGKYQVWKAASKGGIEDSSSAAELSGVSIDQSQPKSRAVKPGSDEQSDHALSHNEEAPIGESELEIDDDAELSNSKDREGLEPSLQALLHDHGDLFSDD